MVSGKALQTSAEALFALHSMRAMSSRPAAHLNCASWCSRRVLVRRAYFFLLPKWLKKVSTVVMCSLPGQSSGEARYLARDLCSSFNNTF